MAMTEVSADSILFLPLLLLPFLAHLHLLLHDWLQAVYSPGV
jgi:hypothetical protein